MAYKDPDNPDDEKRELTRGEQIKAARERQHFSQQALADRIEARGVPVKRETLSNLERDIYGAVRSELAAALCAELQLEPSVFGVVNNGISPDSIMPIVPVRNWTILAGLDVVMLQITYDNGNGRSQSPTYAIPPDRTAELIQTLERALRALHASVHNAPTRRF